MTTPSIKLLQERLINASKGVPGVGRIFGAASVLLKKPWVLEAGDYARNPSTRSSMSAPLAYDLWYLHNDVNLVHHIDPATDSEVYVNENLKFLEDKLEGLKPLKAITPETLAVLAGDKPVFDAAPVDKTWGYNPSKEAPPELPEKGMDLLELKEYIRSLVLWSEECKRIEDEKRKKIKDLGAEWENTGAYFIQVMAYELGQEGTAFDYSSKLPGTDGQYNQDDYCGGLMFPVGQLGIMEVISMFQETELEAENFGLDEFETPVIIDETEMFAPMSKAGEGYSFGRFLVEKGYLVPEEVKSQVELMSSVIISIKDYTQDVKPKSWTKWWIKKTDKLPVPGEFVGILIKPLSVPPHVWWFQESTPLLYAGNWVETENLTSGVITMVTLEAARTDGGVGNEYWVKVNGIEFIAYASDFKLYAVNDRVAVLKRWTTSKKATRSFTWKDQRDGQHPVKSQVSQEFMIMPITFYKED